MGIEMIGTSSYEVLSDDLYRLVFVGDINGPQMRAIMTKTRAFAQGKSYVLAAVDQTNFVSVDAEARKVVAEEAKYVPTRGLIFYGVTFKTKIVTQLILGAIQLVNATDMPAYFAKDESDGNAWIEARRKVLQAEFAR